MRFSAAVAVVLLAGSATILPAGTVLHATRSAAQVTLGTRHVPLLTYQGLQFRDLDRDGKLSPFEDWRRPAEQRAADLIARMTLAEKAGALLHDAVPMADDQYDYDGVNRLIADGHLSSFITRLSGDGHKLAMGANRLQEMAERTRLAIPLTISTDPRSHFQVAMGASVDAGAFSRWPETTGLAAIGDEKLVERFATIARHEYRAAGINMVLGPQADIASEPRWPRINGTFGDRPALVSRLAGAYVRGFQNGAKGLQPGGIPAVVKHWAGYGASEQGYDAHNYYGRYASLTPRSLRLHEDAFTGAFRAGVSGVMPAYSILRDYRPSARHWSGVGVAFDRQLLSGQLRGKRHFKGLILSDWGVTRDCGEICRSGFAPGVRPTLQGFSTAWGMEDATPDQRVARALAAGIDQFGGTSDSAPVIAAFEHGGISQQVLDAAVFQVMVLKFRTGLFENPYVDLERATHTVGNPEFVAEGLRAQSQAMVLLKETPGLFPLKPGTRVYLHGVATDAATALGLVSVDDPHKAQVALFRMSAPFHREHTNFYFGAKQHEGRLSFDSSDPELSALIQSSKVVPTVAVVYLDRPAVLTPVVSHAAGVLADFGASDRAVLSALLGTVRPVGRLPFEIPASDAAVEAQRSDLPHDSVRPLFRSGYGLSFPH